MDVTTPSELFNLYKQKKISKKEFINDLLTICNYSDSTSTRIECLELINSEGKNREKYFNIFEEFALSDNDSEVRLNSIKLIIQSYPIKGFDLIKYLIENSPSLEFVLRLSKLMGENIFYLNKELRENYANILKQIILKIFEIEDVKSFELIFGNWLNKTPKNFWNFLSELNNPVGLLEILDYYINNEEVFKWFYRSVFDQFNVDHWILFLDNLKFSGRLLYILMRLDEENPPIRFYKITGFFEKFGQDLTNDQKLRIVKILNKRNLYDLVILILFGWLKYFEKEVINQLINNVNSNLILNLCEIVNRKRYGFLTHFSFNYILIQFLFTIYNNVDRNYVIQFFKGIKPEFKEIFITNIYSMQQSLTNNEFPIEIKHLGGFKRFLSEILKQLPENRDLK